MIALLGCSPPHKPTDWPGPLDECRHNAQPAEIAGDVAPDHELGVWREKCHGGCAAERGEQAGTNVRRDLLKALRRECGGPLIDEFDAKDFLADPVGERPLTCGVIYAAGNCAD